MKGNTAQLAAQLAPLEEQDKHTAAKQIGTTRDPSKTMADVAFGAIVVDQDDMSLPKDMLEEGGEKTFLGMEPVVLVILVFMLAFVLFIAWQISEMPAK
ncbi:MAG: hypothetical protein ABI596_11355 [Pyrinomonadaceae bacterium]